MLGTELASSNKSSRVWCHSSLPMASDRPALSPPLRPKPHPRARVRLPARLRFPVLVPAPLRLPEILAQKGLPWSSSMVSTPTLTITRHGAPRHHANCRHPRNYRPSQTTSSATRLPNTSFKSIVRNSSQNSLSYPSLHHGSRINSHRTNSSSFPPSPTPWNPHLIWTDRPSTGGSGNTWARRWCKRSNSL